jgi:choice-of-anchor A domain-containing protein
MKSLSFQTLIIAASVMASSLASSLAFAGPFTEPFAGANQFSLIVAGDANLGNGVHVHGAGYIGGNLTVKGSNGGFGQALPAGSLGLVVGNNVSASGNRQIAMFNKSYHVGGTINNVTLQNPGTQVMANPLAPLNAMAIGTALSNKSAELASQASTGASVNASDFNNIMISLTAGITNVLNLNASNASFLGNQNSNINFLNFTAGTKLIVNYDLGGSDFVFKAKNQNLATSVFDDVIWNFVGTNKVTFANSVSTFKGTIFAANSLVDWKANDIDGQLVAKSLVWNQTSQSHYYTPWSQWEPEPEAVVETPEPELMLLLLSGLIGLGLARKTARRK